MRTLKRLMERLLASWLEAVVETEGYLPTLWTTTSNDSPRFYCSVLTPSVQRTLDQSA